MASLPVTPRTAHVASQHPMRERDTALRKRYEELITHGKENGSDWEKNLSELRKLVLMEGIPPMNEEDAAAVMHGEISLRGTIWKILLGVRTLSAAAYLELVGKGAAPEYQKIRKDTGRTFRTDEKFNARVSEEKLLRVLNAFAHTCTGTKIVPYVQGLNSPAGILLYVMPELDSFHCLSILLKDMHHTYWTNNLTGAHVAHNLAWMIVQRSDPELWLHIRSDSTFHAEFLLHFFLSLGGSQRPLEEVLKLWDFYMAFGFHMNVVCTAARIILMRDVLFSTKNPTLTFNKADELPEVDAQLVINLAVYLVRELPDDFYHVIAQHGVTEHYKPDDFQHYLQSSV